MSKLSQKGSAALGAMAGLAVVFGFTSFYIHQTAAQRFSGMLRTMNQLEGFHSSEVAAWQNLQLDQANMYPTSSGSRMPSSMLNSYMDSICTSSTCIPNSVTLPTDDGAPITLKQIMESGTNPDPNPQLFRRMVAGSLQLEKPSTTTSAYCGMTTYPGKQKGAKTCLARAVSVSVPSNLVCNFSGSRPLFYDMLVQPDQKIVASGVCDSNVTANSTLFPGAKYRDIFVIRWLADGNVDTAFGNAGIALVRSPSSEQPSLDVKKIFMQNDRILVAGSNAVVRLLPTGQPDPSFGSSGIALFHFYTCTYYAHVIPCTLPIISFEIQSAVNLQNGKIILSGYGVTSSIHGPSMVRLLENGSIDTSFGNGGIVIYASTSSFANPQWGSPDRYVERLSLMPNGNILGAGEVIVTHMTPDGGFVNSFNGNGRRKLNPSNVRDPLLPEIGNAPVYYVPFFSISDVKLLSDGKTLVAGAEVVDVVPKASTPGFDLIHRHTLERILPNGNMDTTFGNGGIVETTDDFNAGIPAYRRLPQLFIQSDQKIVLVNNYGTDKGTDIFITRFNANGTPDTSYGTNGKVVLALPAGEFEQIQGASMQADNKVLILGLVHVLRFTAAGALDTTFATGGKWTW